MDWSILCRFCGGPARRERDWRGDERIVCDAYQSCDQRAVREYRRALEDARASYGPIFGDEAA